jgi:hypothetical protein
LRARLDEIEASLIWPGGTEAARERGFLLGGQDAHVIQEAAGDAEGVDFDWQVALDSQSERPLIATHNHVKPWPLSSGDVAWGLKARVDEIRAVTPSGRHSAHFPRRGRPHPGLVYADAKTQIGRINDDIGSDNLERSNRIDALWHRLAATWRFEYASFDPPPVPAETMPTLGIQESQS